MMANAFKTSIAGLEKELEALITDNQIQVLFGFILLNLAVSNDKRLKTEKVIYLVDLAYMFSQFLS
jgi:hypothetical protein